MSDRSLVAPIALGIALTGVTGVCLYLLLKKEEDWSDERSHVTSRHVVLEVKIPKDSVGIVIGRQGSNIKEIQAKTETRINFRDELETEEYRVAAIRGSPDGAQLAEILIHQTLAQQPRVETVVMEVPSRNVGRVIGRRGETVKSISRASRCKVEVEPETKAYETKIILRGSSNSIEAARNMIMEKVREAQALDLRDGFDDFDMFSEPPVAEDAAIKAGGEARQPRLKYQQPLFLSHEPQEEEVISMGEQEDLKPTAMDNCIEVFVSAVATPGRFWVQKIGPHSVDLDKLTQEMTDYYNQEENVSFHTLSCVDEGEIVAARYSDETSFYRARVVSFREDSYDKTRSTVDLDFVDFGDAEEKSIGEVFSLKTDFLKLKFQAVECTLAGVRPVGTGEWSEESVSQFASLVHCALWKVVWAKVIEHKAGPKGCLVPCVELIEPESSGCDRNLGHELVKLGLAEALGDEVEVRLATRDN